MTLVERFLKYVSFDTQSNEESGVTPSTPGQMVFARFLKEELEALGLEEITLDENGYLFATLPANIDKSVPVVGFIAHMDTSPDMSGKDVSPRIVENYDGKDIVLCADEQVVLSPARFPELLDHKGEDLIVTNGKTLLGADASRQSWSNATGSLPSWIRLLFRISSISRNEVSAEMFSTL